MNQSTIYRRHEARLLRTLAKKDDQRPALIRILSGLPGFRMVVSPYKPAVTLTATRIGNLPKHEASAFSQNTVFSTDEMYGLCSPRQPVSSPLSTPLMIGAAAIGAGMLFSVSKFSPPSHALKGGIYPFLVVQGAGISPFLSLSHHAHNLPKRFALVGAAATSLMVMVSRTNGASRKK
mmetsp:Transcript_6960/g.12751  ORF Transcript_6960/g.12751 Transcript_6960/m.12751 type:complete len:178 (+) Transcript_6960:70-603(+)